MKTENLTKTHTLKTFFNYYVYLNHLKIVIHIHIFIFVFNRNFNMVKLFILRYK